jgi:UDP-glucose 4-epimerase
MNVLVIGAAGFIGAHLVKKLKAQGYRVAGLDVDGQKGKLVLGNSVPFHCCDFGAQVGIKNILRSENVEVVILSAERCSTAESVQDPIRCFTNNVLGIVFLLDTLLRNSITKFVYVSSANVFGDAEKMPIDEHTVRAPINPIGISQLFVENMLESLKEARGLTYAIARAPEVVGMSEIENEYFVENLGDGLVSDILSYVIGRNDTVNICGTSYDTIDGTAERDFLHVDDFCGACVNILPKLMVRGEGMRYNVGSGKKYSAREVVAVAEKVFGVSIKTTDIPAKPGEPARAYFDIHGARNDLDWSPKYDSLEQILKTILPYYAGRQRR